MGSIQGAVTLVNQQGKTAPLQGVQIKLNTVSGSMPPVSSITDEEGRYRFTGLSDDVYLLEVSADGFDPQTETSKVAKGVAVIRNFSLHIATFVQSAMVREQPGEIETESTNNAAKVTNKEMTDLPLGKQNMNAALAAPVVPSIVQTANGLLSIKGAVENQGMLLVDSVEAVDPVTGSFEVPVPLDAIQSVSVMETPYNAQYGGFSGGLTEIQTKPPSDRWQFGLNDFLPGWRGKNGHLRGVQDWDPRLFVTGPVLKGKLNFSEVVTYQFDRPPVRGLTWPENETITRGTGTMTTLQAIFSDRHVLNVSLNVFTHRVQFADINALVPQTASSDDGQHGFWVGANDSYQFPTGMLLNTIVRYTRLNSDAQGQGPADMLITPDGWGGNYFNSWTRTGQQFQFVSSLGLPTQKWHGRHELKGGADFTERSYDGTSQAHPVQLLREDGSLAEQIGFQGAGRLRGNDAEISEFVQDHWSVNDHLTFDMGARLVSQTAGRDAALAPRVAAAYSPGKSQKTVVRVGAGLFYDRVPLLTTDFTDNLTRVVSTFDASSHLVGVPVLYENTYLEPVAGGGFSPTNSPPEDFARNFTWNVEMEQEIRRGLQLRVSYLQSQTQNLPVVIPLPASALSGGNALLGLASVGSSRYYGLQASVHYQVNQRQQVNVSYLHSRARGDLNTLSGIYVPFEQPVIHPNLSGVLPEDVPNRVVAWGTFALPFKLMVSPIMDVHTGLPYSVVDASQNYVGAPNTARYPYYFSVDMQVYREFQLSSLPFLKRVKNRTGRIGIFSFDVTGHKNPNAVFSTVTSPNFGSFAGFARRVDGFVFEFH